MVLATVPDAPPTRRNHRATSWPAPISAKEPNIVGSRFSESAFWCVPIFSVVDMAPLRVPSDFTTSLGKKRRDLGNVRIGNVTRACGEARVAARPRLFQPRSYAVVLVSGFRI